MHRADDYRLTVHYWLRAAEAGFRPERCTGFSLDDSPALYRPYEFDFSNPPSREDLLAVVTQTPWMSGWRETLLTVIDANQWPMISPGMKAASVDLRDASGRNVGRLEVSRSCRYVNLPYTVPFFGTYRGSDIDRHLTRRFRCKTKRVRAREYVEASRHLILERVARSGDSSATRLLDEVDRVLSEGGIAGKPSYQTGSAVL